ncbi:hypothetical protein UCRPC4_g05674 [Phaeomoniella chlamydospora]|uniref:Uncharacterized protein n=1 Tax=Phaeomoniella chlamydospora TaxID=158046 RepID=A0A0G2E4A9_PHACM|nr:hypothetical protein UCRPC4_g05674 [Phaeomoniella chlamydospora]
MSPLRSQLLTARKNFNPGLPSEGFKGQWTHPSDVFAVLLLLGGDVVSRAIAQLAGGRITPVAFSFGWVSYAITALLAGVGENKLMPQADCACKVINGRNGYVRDNTSWVIGRLVRDFEKWQDEKVKSCLKGVLDAKAADLKKQGIMERPRNAGLVVSIYHANRPLGIAAIPCGIYGDWGILMITACGIGLAFATGGLKQWRVEKWACRLIERVKPGNEKTVVLTRGNGSQHAIVIVGSNGCLDLEDLSMGASNADFTTSWETRSALFVLAILWVLLLITTSGIKKNTWFLLAVGSIGMVQNIVVAGSPRDPAAFGMPMTFHQVIGKTKVMETLFAVDEKYKGLGRSMREIFFPGGHLGDWEKTKWDELAKRKE